MGLGRRKPEPRNTRGVFFICKAKRRNARSTLYSQLNQCKEQIGKIPLIHYRNCSYSDKCCCNVNRKATSQLLCGLGSTSWKNVKDEKTCTGHWNMSQKGPLTISQQAPSPLAFFAPLCTRLSLWHSNVLSFFAHLGLILKEIYFCKSLDLRYAENLFCLMVLFYLQKSGLHILHN